jgi:hypothetical protein
LNGLIIGALVEADAERGVAVDALQDVHVVGDGGLFLPAPVNR